MGCMRQRILGLPSQIISRYHSYFQNTAKTLFWNDRLCKAMQKDLLSMHLLV